jgi:hypothetical protein
MQEKLHPLAPFQRSGRRSQAPFSDRSRPAEMSRQSRPQAARSRGSAVAVKPSRRTMRAPGMSRVAVRIEADGPGLAGTVSNRAMGRAGAVIGGGAGFPAQRAARVVVDRALRGPAVGEGRADGSLRLGLGAEADLAGDLAGVGVGADDAGDRVLVGDGDGGQAEEGGTFDVLLGVGAPGEEGEVRGDVEFCEHGSRDYIHVLFPCGVAAA